MIEIFPIINIIALLAKFCIAFLDDGAIAAQRIYRILHCDDAQLDKVRMVLDGRVVVRVKEYNFVNTCEELAGDNNDCSWKWHPKSVN